MGKSMVSGFDFPLNQSIERTGQRPMWIFEEDYDLLIFFI
jgi:hypothetical protein